MLKINLKRLKKEQIIWLSENRCRHHHFYIEHLKCLETEKPDLSPVSERVGFLDIESVGLQGNWDYIISYAILGNDGKLVGRHLTPKEVLNYKILDKNLMKEFGEEVKNFDRIVVYYGTNHRFDIPFLRTRSLKWNTAFPIYKDVNVTDCYDIVKLKLKLHSNRLQVACEFLGIPTKTHPQKPDMWISAKLGNIKALKFIWEHNKEDVESLRALYNRIEGFSAARKTSI